MQLLKLHSQASCHGSRKNRKKYTSPPIQNEIIPIMALGILRKVANSVLEDAFFTIMVDETTDVSNREQVVLVLHETCRQWAKCAGRFHRTICCAIHRCSDHHQCNQRYYALDCNYPSAVGSATTEPVICQAQSVGSPQTSPQKNQGPSIHSAMDMLSTIGDTIRGSKVLWDSLDTGVRFLSMWSSHPNVTYSLKNWER